MRKILFLFLASVAFAANAQVNTFADNAPGAIKLGIGYVHDFPGLNGLGVHTQYSFPLNEWLQGEVGLKRIQTSGNPRTKTITEYTRATTLDFNLLFVPFHTEKAAVRIGAGYAFSFYNIRRSYPVFEPGTNLPSIKEPNWVGQDDHGRVGGISLIGEYEYYFDNNLSIGARVTFARAYNHVLMGGPFAAFRF